MGIMPNLFTSEASNYKFEHPRLLLAFQQEKVGMPSPYPAFGRAKEGGLEK